MVELSVSIFEKVSFCAWIDLARRGFLCSVEWSSAARFWKRSAVQSRQAVSRHLQLPESDTSVSDQKTPLLQGCIAKCGDAALFRMVCALEGAPIITTMIQYSFAQHRCLLQLPPCFCQSLNITVLCTFPPRLLGSSGHFRPSAPRCCERPVDSSARRITLRLVS